MTTLTKSSSLTGDKSVRTAPIKHCCWLFSSCNVICRVGGGNLTPLEGIGAGGGGSLVPLVGCEEELPLVVVVVNGPCAVVEEGVADDSLMFCCC